MSATFDYTRSRAIADRALAKYGQDCTLTTPGGAPRSARVLEIGVVTKRFADTNVMIGDTWVLLGATAAPAPGDVLVRSRTRPDTGIVFNERMIVVDPVTVIKPSSTTVVYECYLRNG